MSLCVYLANLARVYVCVERMLNDAPPQVYTTTCVYVLQTPLHTQWRVYTLYV